jgi:hypothetical protein
MEVAVAHARGMQPLDAGQDGQGQFAPVVRAGLPEAVLQRREVGHLYQILSDLRKTRRPARRGGGRHHRSLVLPRPALDDLVADPLDPRGLQAIGHSRSVAPGGWSRARVRA